MNQDPKHTWLGSWPLAHRGLFHHPDLPENSLAAFEAALALGYGIELDVRALTDGTIAVFHDSSLRRMTGIDGVLQDLTRESLGAPRLLGTGQRIPLLSEVLALVGGRAPIYVEIKNDGQPGPLEAGVARLLDEYAGPIAVASFNWRSVAWFKAHRPAITRGLISADFRNSKEGIGPVRAWGRRNLLAFPLCRPDFIAYALSALSPARQRCFATLFRVPLLAWTIRTDADLALCRELRLNPVFETVRP